MCYFHSPQEKQKSDILHDPPFDHLKWTSYLHTLHLRLTRSRFILRLDHFLDQTSVPVVISSRVTYQKHSLECNINYVGSLYPTCNMISDPQRWPVFLFIQIVEINSQFSPYCSSILLLSRCKSSQSHPALVSVSFLFTEDSPLIVLPSLQSTLRTRFDENVSSLTIAASSLGDLLFALQGKPDDIPLGRIHGCACKTEQLV